MNKQDFETTLAAAVSAPRHPSALAAIEASISSDIHAILSARGDTHGDFADHAAFTQALKRILYDGYRPEHSDILRESAEMIAHKLGRILAGDPDFKDHWADIAGYATLVADRCTK